MSQDFESSLKSLNDLVDKMEQGNASLDTLLTQFEQGVKLVKHCQTLLNTAEQKIALYNKEKNTLSAVDPKTDSDNFNNTNEPD